MKNIIFYFTGTGNSLWTAKYLAKHIDNCDVIPMSEYDTTRPVTAERIGFVFPVFNWGLPNIVKKFISELQITNTPYLFSIHTYGGYDGITSLQMKSALANRGYVLNASFKTKLPQNYIVSYFKVPKNNKIDALFSKAKLKLNSATTIIEGKKNYFQKEFILFKPFHSYGYKLNTSESKLIPTKDKNFIVNDNCTLCGICIKSCPVKNIKIENKQIIWNNNCEFCLSCLHHCPKDAINFGTKTIDKKRYKNNY